MATLASAQTRGGTSRDDDSEIRVLLCGTGRTGLGQTVRLTRIARLLSRLDEGRIRVTVATGIPRAAELFGSRRYETVELHAPACLTRWGRQPGGRRQRLRGVLAAELLDVINAVRPHAFVTPHHAGIGGELPLAYPELRRRGTRIVLALRDQYDRDAFADRELLVDNLREYVDQVIVCAPRWAVQGIPDTVVRARHAPVTFVGFVGPSPTVSCLSANRRDRVVTCQVGGGIDGLPVLRATVAAARRARSQGLEITLQLAPGPFTPPRDVARLARDLGEIGTISAWTFRDESEMRLQEELRVSMAGYNTCVEAVWDGVPAVLAPRSRRGDREQARRASLFAAAFPAISTLPNADISEMTEAIISRLLTPAVGVASSSRRGFFAESTSVSREVLGA